MWNLQEAYTNQYLEFSGSMWLSQNDDTSLLAENDFVIIILIQMGKKNQNALGKSIIKQGAKSRGNIKHANSWVSDLSGNLVLTTELKT